MTSDPCHTHACDRCPICTQLHICCGQVPPELRTKLLAALGDRDPLNDLTIDARDLRAATWGPTAPAHQGQTPTVPEPMNLGRTSMRQGAPMALGPARALGTEIATDLHQAWSQHRVNQTLANQPEPIAGPRKERPRA